MSSTQSPSSRRISAREANLFVLGFLCLLGLFALTPSATAALPTISEQAALNITDGSVTLSADLNPGGEATRYHFEYGDQGPCSANPCIGVPANDGSLVASSSAVSVSREVTGLAAATIYHFRLVATNDSGRTDGTDGTFTTYSASQQFGACENDELRVGAAVMLPDCRAFEQVSPVEKNGGEILGQVTRSHASPGGDAVTYFATAGIPGGVAKGTLPFFLASRVGGDWSSADMSAPAIFGHGFVDGWTRDLTFSFADARNRLGGPGAILARDNGSGTFEAVYPSNDGRGVAVVASSEDSSIVLLSSEQQLTPGASSSGTKLYAYEPGAADPLSLVSILPDSACDEPPCSVRDVAFGSTLNTPIGTGSNYFLTGSLARDYPRIANPISDSGDRVFFVSRPSLALYARSGLTNGHPVTHEISASRKTNGNLPNGRDAGGAKPLAFQLASADGSKAFFTSSEMLTDDAYTGPEADTFPTIGHADVGIDPPGTPDHDFLSSTLAKGVAVADHYLYWADTAAEAIGRADLDPSRCAPSPAPCDVRPDFVTDATGGPNYVAVDGDRIYWSASGGGQVNVGTIGRADLPDDPAGSPENVEPSCITGASDPQGIAVGVDADPEHRYLYWANTAGVATRRIGRTDLRAGTGSCADLNAATNQAFLAPFSPLRQMAGLAVDADHIYWGVSNNGAVGKAAIDGTDPGTYCVLPTAGANAKAGVIVVGDYIYWSNTAGNAIGRVSKEDCSTDLNATWLPGTSSPVGLAIDGEDLYYAGDQAPHTNPGTDLYMWEVEGTGACSDESPGYGAVNGGCLTDISVDVNAGDICPESSGDPCGADVQGVLGGSPDGDYVYFVANGVLADNAGARGLHASPGNCDRGARSDARGNLTGADTVAINARGICNLYVWRDDGSTKGAISFIARLDTENNFINGEAVSDARNWLRSGGGSSLPLLARISRDGSLVFRSQLQLTEYDTMSRGAMFYRYTPGGELSCMTCNPTGEPPSGNARLFSAEPLITPGVKAENYDLTQNFAVSGKRFFFETRDKLTVDDKDGSDCPDVKQAGSGPTSPSCLDVYEWEAEGHGSCEQGSASYSPQSAGCIYLLSTGTGTNPSFFAEASASGDDVFIMSRDPLVRGDRDALQDLYDVRSGGGIASQQAVESPACTEDDCQGPPAESPPIAATGSQSLNGSGNSGRDHSPPKKKRGKCTGKKGKAKKRCLARRKCARKHGKAKQRCKRKARAKAAAETSRGTR